MRSWESILRLNRCVYEAIVESLAELEASAAKKNDLCDVCFEKALGTAYRLHFTISQQLQLPAFVKENNRHRACCYSDVSEDENDSIEPTVKDDVSEDSIGLVQSAPPTFWQVMTTELSVGESITFPPSRPSISCVNSDGDASDDTRSPYFATSSSVVPSDEKNDLKMTPRKYGNAPPINPDEDSRGLMTSTLFSDTESCSKELIGFHFKEPASSVKGKLVMDDSGSPSSPTSVVSETATVNYGDSVDLDEITEFSSQVDQVDVEGDSNVDLCANFGADDAFEPVFECASSLHESEGRVDCVAVIEPVDGMSIDSSGLDNDPLIENGLRISQEADFPSGCVDTSLDGDAEGPFIGRDDDEAVKITNPHTGIVEAGVFTDDASEEEEEAILRRAQFFSLTRFLNPFLSPLQRVKRVRLTFCGDGVVDQHMAVSSKFRRTIEPQSVSGGAADSVPRAREAVTPRNSTNDVKTLRPRKRTACASGTKRLDEESTPMTIRRRDSARGDAGESSLSRRGRRGIVDQATYASSSDCSDAEFSKIRASLTAKRRRQRVGQTRGKRSEKSKKPPSRSLFDLPQMSKDLYVKSDLFDREVDTDSD